MTRTVDQGAPAFFEAVPFFETTVLRRCPSCQGDHPWKANPGGPLVCPDCRLPRDPPETTQHDVQITGVWARLSFVVARLLLRLGRHLFKISERL